MPIAILVLSASAAVSVTDPDIVVTASRDPVPVEEAAASATIFDSAALDALALPDASSVLRLSPGISVATSGPRGTQTQLRIRGAEANHTLLFVDGIRFNDPASGNEARFELLTTDLLSRIEIVRGPQSALWGSEALGGVIAVETPDPLTARGVTALAEYGSLDSLRTYGRASFGSDRFGITAAGGYERSDGIDSFGGGGERDGFHIGTASIKAVYRTGPVELGASGYWVGGVSQFDGTDPVTFLRADTLDSTRNRIAAVRGWATGTFGGWTVRAETSYLDSANHNYLAGDPLNQTYGNRLSLGGQLSRRFGNHELIAAIDHGEEDFRARDTAFGGATNQHDRRDNTGFVGEWRARWSDAFMTDVALRHDSFSDFADATTFRGAALLRPVHDIAIHAAYGEGIAQPTFFDLFGFFPGSFEGNPGLKPERSRGWEAGASWTHGPISAGLTYFSARLHDEIVDVFDSTTFLSGVANAAGISRRDGIEASFAWRAAGWLNLAANYTWLKATQQTEPGDPRVREVRRPRSTANVVAYGDVGRFSWSTSLAYVGARTDQDFDLFPAPTVRLSAYTLGSARIAYRVAPRVELYARVENAFDDDYQDVVGYNTPGRTVYAGLRVALGR